MPGETLNRLADRYADRPSTDPMDRSTFRLMTTMVSPSASSANTVVSTRMNWMFAELRNRGCTRVVTSTNTARTTTMPDSLMRNTRSASTLARGPDAAAAGPGGRC